MEKIKILHSADAHGDLEAIKIYSDYIKKQKPDIAFLTGDLIHRVYTKENLNACSKEIEEYQNKKGALLSAVAEEVKKIGGKKMNEIFPAELFAAIQNDELKESSIILPAEENQEEKIYSTKDLHEMVKDTKTIPQRIWEEITPYLNARERFKEYQKEHVTIAERSMETQYNEIKRMLQGTDCLVLPGNHDGKCLEKIMPERNMHRNTKTIKGILISGYGSAKGKPWWIPEALLEDFRIFTKTHEGKILGQIPEAVDFIMKQDPEIAVFHETAYTDEIIRSYITHKGPDIVLAGHMHEQVLPEKCNIGTYLIMPGKLGTAPTLEGGLIELTYEESLIEAPKEGFRYVRTFVEIDLLKEGECNDLVLKPKNIFYKQIKNNKVAPLAEFEYNDIGLLKKVVIHDEETWGQIPKGL